MSSTWRRFEVLLPLQFNDGRDVPAEGLAEAVLEIVDNFGAASYETQKVEGHWCQAGVLYRDNLAQPFRQNITIQFSSCFCRSSARKRALRIRVYPRPSVAKSPVFFGVRSVFEVWFWATDGHGYTRIEYLGFTETIY